MVMLLLWWFAIVAAGLSVGLAVWVAGTWGQVQTVRQRTARIRRLVRTDEPLLPQLWRFLQVLAGMPAVGKVAGSFGSFQGERLEDALAQAHHPWGLKSPADVYAIGLVLGCGLEASLLYLMGFSLMTVALIPISLLAGLGLPVFAVRMVASGIRQAMVRELWTLMSGLEVYLQPGVTMYDALKESASACPLLSPYIDRALLKWGSVGPAAALDELGRELRLPEAFMVVGAIRQAVDLDPATLAAFMLRESTRLDRAMEAAQRKSAQLKPMLQNAVLVLPAFNIFILMTAPWAYGIYEQLQTGTIGP